MRVLDILLSGSSGVPYYEQILTQIKQVILVGELVEGDPLPSMRQLAKELRVSVITTKRAYEELEQAGFITTVVGKGSFVGAPDTGVIQEEHRLGAEKHLQLAVNEARLGGISLRELTEILQLFYEGEA